MPALKTQSAPSPNRAVFFLLILSACFVAKPLPAQVIWTGAGLPNNTNWSVAGNWSGGTPGTTANILFTNSGAVTTVSNINNVVDGNTTILSLQYANTNNFHTTLINPGIALTVSNNAAANLLVVGTLADQGTNQTLNATLTGVGGALVIVGTNVNSVAQIQQGSTNTGPHVATLDMSGLGIFNLTAGRLLVAGNAGSVGASNYLAGTLTLAKTNIIQLNGTNAPTLIVGDATTNPNSLTNFLILGQTNSLFADTITVGRAKQISTLKFNPSLAGSNPALYLRGKTATRVSALALGDNAASSTSSTSTGTVDLSLGTVDAQVASCFVARGQPGTGTGGAVGILNLNAGVFNVNTLSLATVSVNNAPAGANVTGTVNVTGTATLVVNSTLALGINPGVTNTARGTLNITNGAVFANSISTVSTGAVVGVISVNNGQLTLTNAAGAPGVPLSALNLTTASLHLNASPVVTNIVATNVTVSGTTTISIDSIAYPGGTVNCPLISYAGTDPFLGLTLGPLGAYTGLLVDNAANKRIDLQITAGPITPVPGSIIWGGGVNNNWDTTSANWTNSGITTFYADTDFLTFNDLGQTGSVNLASAVAPGSIIVSNSALAYAITGTGTIGGAGGLTKLGAGSLTLGTSNSFTGGIGINAGNVKATTASALPTNATVNFGAGAPTTATLDLQGTSQTVSNLVFNNIGTSTITVTGGSVSALTVSPAALTFGPFATTNSLFMNMGGLNSFIYNNNSGTFSVNNGGSLQSSSVGQTTVTLAGGTNLVTAGTLNVGNTSPSSGVINSTVNLGTNNTLNAGAINLGGGRTGGTLQFTSGITGGTLTIAGATGAGSTAALTVGNGHDSFQASDKPVNLVDTTAGTLSAQLGTVNIGVGSPSTGSGRGFNATSSLKMGAGTLTAASMTLGTINQKTTATNYTIILTNLFSINNGGTANITNLTLANNNLTPAGASNFLTNNATVSLTNGANLNATTIQLGSAASPATTIAQILWGDGTLGNISGGNLLVNGVSVVLQGAATTHNVNISAGQTGQINAWISGTGTLTDVGSGALTLNGQNSFNGSLIMAGTNTLTLSGTNTYPGSTLITSGTLLLGANGAISNSPNITVASNAVFDVSAVTGGFLLQPNQSLTGSGGVNGGVSALAGSQIIPGGIGVAGTLTFSNNLALNGQAITYDLSANPASGNDLLNVGQALTLNANATIFWNPLAGSLAANSTYTLMNYGSLQANSHAFILVAPRGMSLSVGANALTLNVGVVSNASLTWVGDGTQNNWDVQTTTNWVHGGTLDYFFQYDSVTFDNTGSAAPVINLTTTLFPTNVTVNGSQNYTFSGGGQLAGAMSLTNNGTGTLTLSTSNTYTGGTAINAGTVQLTFTNATAALPDFAAGTGPIIDNGNLNITNGGGAPLYVLFTNTISGSGAINLPQNQEIKFNGPGSLAGFTGTINIPAGVVTQAKGDITATNVSLNSSAIINIANGGTIWVGGNGVVVPATAYVSGFGNAENWGALRVDSGANFSGPVNLLGNASIGAQNTSSGTISGIISDGGNGYSLTKLGPQPVILTGANTYSGGTTISNSTLQVGNGLVNGTLPGNVNIAVSNTTLSFVVATNTSLTYNGAISGPGSLTENGFGGTLYLNGMNTFTNGVTINAGTLWITNAGALGSGPKQINISNGTAGHPELHLNGISGNILLPSTMAFVTSWSGGSGSPGALINEAGNNEIDGSFNLTSGGGGTTFVVNSGTLKLAGSLVPSTTARSVQFGGAGNGTVSGVIADGSGANLLTAVTIAGPGTWTFAGTNTYVTNTTVSGGTLLVNGIIGTGALTVQTNAGLGGTGSIGGPAVLQIGTQLSPGNSGVGTLTFSNSLTLNVTATNNFVVAPTGGASNLVAVVGLLKASNSVIRVSTGTPLHPSTNTLFTYGSINGAFNPAVVFDVAPVHPASLLDNGSGQINLVVSNRPPVASPITVTRLAGSALKIALTSVATNWSDLDGDAVALSAINLTTTNGVTLATNSTWIFYTNNLNVNDQISYGITDGLGGTNIGYINVIVQGSLIGTNSIANIATGNPTILTAYGIPGYNYITERSTNLVDWADILTNTAAGNGTITITDYFSDLGSNAPPTAYYRLKWQP